MSISRHTAAGLLAAHIDNASAVTERPAPHVPYRVRRRRAVYLRLLIAAALVLAFWLAQH